MTEYLVEKQIYIDALDLLKRISIQHNRVTELHSALVSIVQDSNDSNDNFSRDNMVCMIALDMFYYALRTKPNIHPELLNLFDGHTQMLKYAIQQYYGE